MSKQFGKQIFLIFSSIDKKVSNQSLNYTYSYIRQLLQSYVKKKCEGIQFVIHFSRTQGFNFKIMLKVPNWFFIFLRRNFQNFRRQLNPTHALYDKILSTVVKCLWGWNSMTLHRFFPHPSLCLVRPKEKLFLFPGIGWVKVILSLARQRSWISIRIYIF